MTLHRENIQSTRNGKRAANTSRNSEQRVQGKIGEQQTLVGGVSRELLCQRVQGMRGEQQTLVGGVNSELLC